jgi:hypothetical protein
MEKMVKILFTKFRASFHDVRVFLDLSLILITLVDRAMEVKMTSDDYRVL